MPFQYYILENGTDRYLLENGTDLFLTEASAHIVEAVAASAGVASSSVVGAAIFAGVGSSAGVATSSVVGATVLAGIGSSVGVGAAAGISGSTCASVASSDGLATVAGEGENIGIPVVETSLGGELIGRRRPRLRWTEAGDPYPVQVRAQGIELRIEFGNAGVEIQAFALPSARHALTLSRSAAPTSVSAGAVARATNPSEGRAPRAPLKAGIESGARGARPSETTHTRVRAIRNPTDEELLLTHLSLIE